MIEVFIHTLFRVYYFLIFISIILTWVPVNQYNEWVRIIHKLTDPYLDIFKKVIPPIGMIDFSPVIALFSLGIIENLLFRLLYMLGI